VRRAHAPASDGTVRDTAYYSIIAAEWPVVRVVAVKGSSANGVAGPAAGLTADLASLQGRCGEERSPQQEPEVPDQDVPAESPRVRRRRPKYPEQHGRRRARAARHTTSAPRRQRRAVRSSSRRGSRCPQGRTRVRATTAPPSFTIVTAALSCRATATRPPRRADSSTGPPTVRPAAAPPGPPRARRRPARRLPRNLAVCGAAREGVGVPACIRSGRAATASVLTSLDAVTVQT